MENCPHCRSDVEVEATHCANCTRLVRDFKSCRSCMEPISEVASFCPYCSQKVPSEQDLKAKEFTGGIVANPLGAFLTTGNFTALFKPPTMHVADGRIQMTKWSFLGLRIQQQEIRIDRVASVQYTKGVFWGGILVETFGGASEDINQKGFEQNSARTMAEKLRELIAT